MESTISQPIDVPMTEEDTVPDGRTSCKSAPTLGNRSSSPGPKPLTPTLKPIRTGAATKRPQSLEKEPPERPKRLGSTPASSSRTASPEVKSPPMKGALTPCSTAASPTHPSSSSPSSEPERHESATGSDSGAQKDAKPFVLPVWNKDAKPFVPSGGVVAFALPQTALGPREERWNSVSSMETGDRESVDDFVQGGVNAADHKPEEMVLSPRGNSYVKATKRVFFEDSFTIWFDQGSSKKRKNSNATKYANALQEVGSFSSVQEFWRFWNAMDLFGMNKNSSLSVFKNPFKPLWEDDANTDGARFILKLGNPNHATESFTDIVLSLIGATFDCHENLCGAVLSSKGSFYTAQVWTKSFNENLFTQLDVELKTLLGGDYPDEIGWKPHNASANTGSQYDAYIGNEQWYGDGYSSYQQYNYYWGTGG